MRTFGNEDAILFPSPAARMITAVRGFEADFMPHTLSSFGLIFPLFFGLNDLMRKNRLLRFFQGNLHAKPVEPS
jgi:hypothetical protein